VPERAGYLFMQATGAQPLSYQWRFNGTNIVGATRPMLAFPRFTPSQAGAYSVIVSNALGVTLSSDTIVGVAPLLLTASPTNQSVFQGGTVRFQVAATGPSPRTYQWQLNGVEIPGATNATLQWTGVDASKAGAYTVRVGNAYGTVTSRPASLVVNLVAAWGGNGWGQTNVPAGLGEVSAVSLGYTHALAVRTNGTVVAWGNFTAPPPGLSQVVQVAAGLSHDVALRSDGTVVAWGYNDLGETNVPPGLARVVEIATGYSVSFAVTAEGRVVAWGDRSDPLSRVPITATNVMTLSVGTGHVLALRIDGTVVAWGSNAAGQISVPPGLKDVVRVQAAGESSLALRADGTVVSWGRLGNDPVAAELGDIVSLASSGDHCLAATRTGQVIAWGDNACGQTNVPAGLRDVIAVFADGCTSLALRSDGRIVAWGNALAGQAGMVPLMSNVSNVSMKGGNVVVLMRDKPPQTGLAVRLADWNADGFGLWFTPPRQVLYSIERTESLAPAGWEYFPLRLGDGSELLWRDASSETSARFYRVRSW
jgi:alpha-tubulin suppressor-like RCC1 family protein